MHSLGLYLRGPLEIWLFSPSAASPTAWLAAWPSISGTAAASTPWLWSEVDWKKKTYEMISYYTGCPKKNLALGIWIVMTLTV